MVESLSDNAIIATVASSISTLKDVRSRLLAREMVNKRYTAKQMEEAIDVLARKSKFDVNSVIQGAVPKPETEQAVSTLTDSEITTAIDEVVADLRPIIGRLNLESMSGQQYTIDQIKNACNILTYKQVKAEVGIIINENTDISQGARNFVFKEDEPRVLDVQNFNLV